MEGNSESSSPPHRSTILASFLRPRPRNSSDSPTSQPPSPATAHRRSRAAAPEPLAQMLRRRRSAGALPVPTVVVAPPPAASPAPSAPAPAVTHRIRLVPHIDTRRTLRFDAITRDLTVGSTPLRIGRFTDRSGLGLTALNTLSTSRLAFKSKVVSRAHAEIWLESGGKVFIKDTKSSSGTFLNHVRLSPANMESRAFQVRDGDILQLGVDYQGGTEDIYKSVKIRVELGREWQAGANAFNTNTLKILKTLAAPALAPSAQQTPGATTTTTTTPIPDCCICLFGVTIRQALFIAPCSHTFHYKCIRPLLESHHPAFSCPLCRTFADLEEDVEVEGVGEGEEEEEGEEGEGGEGERTGAEEGVGVEEGEGEDADHDTDHADPDVEDHPHPHPHPPPEDEMRVEEPASGGDLATNEMDVDVPVVVKENENENEDGEGERVLVV